MGRRLLIGIGNRLRGDDGVGPRVADSLAARGDGDFETLAVHQLTPELAAVVADAAAVVFVDACPAENAVALEPLAAAGDAPGGAFSHQLSPAQLLALSQALYGRCPPAWQLLIPAPQLELCDELSDAAAAAMLQALRLLEAWPCMSWH